MRTVKLSIPRLSWPETEAIGSQLLSLADGEGWRGLHLDLKDVEFLTAALLGKLVGLHRRVRKKGGKLRLLNVHPFVYEIFTVTQLNKIIDIQPLAAA